MFKKKKNKFSKYFLTLSFASILLFSSGVIAPNAFADSVETTVPVDNYPGGVAVNPITDKIYVANNQGGGISVIDGITNTVVNTVDVHSIGKIDVNPNTNMIYVLGSGTTQSSTVSVINGSNNQITAIIGLSDRGNDLALNPDTNKIYVSEFFEGVHPHWSIQVINCTTNSIEKTIDESQGLHSMAINPITNKVYVSADSSILVVDGATDTVTDNVSVQGNQMSIDPMTNRLYTTGGGSLTVVDLSTNAIVDTMVIGSSLYPVGVNPDTNKIYIGDDGSTGNGNNIYVINGSKNTVVQTLTVGTVPMGIGVNPNTNKIYVSNFNSKTISVIDGHTTVPSAPQNLTATSTSSSQINLSWSAPANNGGALVTGYVIERSNDNGSTWSTIVPNTASTDTTYSDAGLSPNTTYAYNVLAINEMGTSLPSNTASSTTPLLSAAGITIGPVGTQPLH